MRASIRFLLMMPGAYQGNWHADVLSALHRAGVEVAEPAQIRMDGVLCRFSTSGNDRIRRRRNGWAVVFTDGARPVVTCGDWAKGVTETIVLGGGGPLSPAERERQRISIDHAKAARAAELRSRQANAAREANRQWNDARPASAHHPYLMRKGIDTAGLRDRLGFLLVPLRDEAGKIHNVQRIRADGQKRFLKGGRVSDLYASIGHVGDHLLICEGWATGRTLHTVTGLPVAVAFSAGNLFNVAKIIRTKYPSARMTVCADNDIKPDGNKPGVKAATAAAAAVGGYLAIPPIPGDFNDYCAAQSGYSEITEVFASDANDK
jgi:putative DNA primase/helicase